MRKFVAALCFLFFSFLGGAVGQSLGFNNVALGAYQMISVWTGTAGGPIPSWVSSHFGFNTGNQTSTQNGGTPLMSVSTNGQWAAVLASRASDNTGTGYLSTLNNLCVFDNSSFAGAGAWCQYLQGEVLNSMGTKQLIMTESSIYSTQASPTNIDPFTSNQGGLTANLRLDCGDGQAAPQDCSTALQIGRNGAPYANPAIIIGNGGLDTTSNPNPIAIAMPNAYPIGWYTSAGVLGANIFAGSGSPAGIVSCTARCIYIRTDGGASTTLYVNETGGGTSGWAAK